MDPVRTVEAHCNHCGYLLNQRKNDYLLGDQVFYARCALTQNWMAQSSSQRIQLRKRNKKIVMAQQAVLCWWAWQGRATEWPLIEKDTEQVEKLHCLWRQGTLEESGKASWVKSERIFELGHKRVEYFVTFNKKKKIVAWTKPEERGQWVCLHLSVQPCWY